MAKRKRRRRLKNLQIEEVSWVDKPANNIPFAFVKSEGGYPLAKAGAKLNVEFETKGTAETTVCKINGREIKGLQSLSLFCGLGMAGEPVDSGAGAPETPIALGCDYSVKGGDKGGFKQVQTFTLAKSGEIEMVEEEDADSPVAEEDAEALADLGVDAGDADGELAKALAEPVRTVALYKADLPGALAEALTNIVEIAVGTEPAESIEKAEDEVSDEDNKDGKDQEAPKPAEEKPAAQSTDGSIAASLAQIAASLTAVVTSQNAMDARLREIEASKEQAAAEPEPKEQEKEPETEPESREEDEEMVEVDEDALAREALAEVMAERQAAAVS